MPATSIVIVVEADVNFPRYNTDLGKFEILWESVDDLGNRFGGTTAFDANDSPAVINDQIISDAQTANNTMYGNTLGPANPARLLGGVAL